MRLVCEVTNLKNLIYKKVNILCGFIHSKLRLYIRAVLELLIRINSANGRERQCQPCRLSRDQYMLV